MNTSELLKFLDINPSRSPSSIKQYSSNASGNSQEGRELLRKGYSHVEIPGMGMNNWYTPSDGEAVEKPVIQERRVMPMMSEKTTLLNELGTQVYPMKTNTVQDFPMKHDPIEMFLNKDLSVSQDDVNQAIDDKNMMDQGRKRIVLDGKESWYERDPQDKASMWKDEKTGVNLWNTQEDQDRNDSAEMQSHDSIIEDLKNRLKEK
ncbi:MAG: hypothetical protein RIQ94_190 [Pseudomonadota bacterium]|jgi:hypothetical protein